MRSEIGILYTSPKNEQVLMKLMKQHELEFEELFVAKPHVFINSNHPLSKNKVITLEDLEDYPYLSFEQGEYNSFFHGRGSWIDAWNIFAQIYYE